MKTTVKPKTSLDVLKYIVENKLLHKFYYICVTIIFLREEGVITRQLEKDTLYLLKMYKPNVTSVKQLNRYTKGKHWIGIYSWWKSNFQLNKKQVNQTRGVKYRYLRDLIAYLED